MPLFIKNMLNSGMKGWDFILNNIPNQFKVDAEITMDQTVPRAGYSAPLQIWMAGFENRGYFLQPRR